MANALAFSLLLVVLVIAAATDLRTGKVFNWLTYPAILVGLGYWLIVGLIEHQPGAAELAALLGLAAGLVPAGVIVAIGGLGGGDMKLLGAIGAISASWACVLSTAVYGLIVGMILAIAIMIATGRVKQTLLRVLGLVLLMGARTKPDEDEKAPRVPFALALAIGGALAGAEQLLHLHTPWTWLTP